jgi:hypothetical protein
MPSVWLANTPQFLRVEPSSSQGREQARLSLIMSLLGLDGPLPTLLAPSHHFLRFVPCRFNLFQRTGDSPSALGAGNNLTGKVVGIG